MRVKANDQLHVSSVQAAAFKKGEEFDVSDAEGEELLDKGLVTKVAAPRAPAARKPAAKKAPAAKNKMRPAAKNKARGR